MKPEKFTPGPWVVKTTVIGPAASVKVIGRRDRDLSDQEIICMVPQTNDEQTANVALIKAAPEMLNALRCANECLNEYFVLLKSIGTDQNLLKDYEFLLGLTERVISKATGEQA